MPADRTPSKLPFRPDIEGLRGIAIVLVVLYHVGMPGFGGGFVGVDVFFVLSGYLITGLLVHELKQTGRIDIPAFYARRVRRLLPASALMVVVVALTVFFILSPYEQQKLTGGSVATALYSSNVYFARLTTNYLAGGAQKNAMLHTWSLAVEEQFYLAWPLFIGLAAVGFAAFRATRGEAFAYNRRRVVVAMAAVTIVSIVLCVWLTGKLQPWAFFLSPPRAWEFSVGGLAAILPFLRVRPKFQKTATVAAGWLGFTGILAATFLFSKNLAYPGYAALLPVAGTALVLAASANIRERSGSESMLARMLSVRPLQALGRVSYAWYLWHWPVLVIAQMLADGLTLPGRIALAAASLLLAAQSYRLVENPIRRSLRLRASTGKSLALGGLLTIGVLVLVGSFRITATAMANTPEQRRFYDALRDVPPNWGMKCNARFWIAEAKVCEFPAPGSETTIALIGDSHAEHWISAFQEIAANHHWTLIVISKPGCPATAIRFVHPDLKREYTECTDWRENAFARLEQIRPDAVIAASSAGYASDLGWVSVADWEAGVDRLLDRMNRADLPVIYMIDTPQTGNRALTCLARSAWYQRLHLPVSTAICEVDRDFALSADVAGAERRAAKGRADVTLVDLSDSFCTPTSCRAEIDGLVVYRDDDHLTSTFSRAMAPHLDSALTALLDATAY